MTVNTNTLCRTGGLCGVTVVTLALSACLDEPNGEDAAFAAGSETLEFDELEATVDDAGEAPAPATEPGPPNYQHSPPDETTVGLFCSQSNDCHPYCVCSGGTCVPDGFGPPPDGDVCNQPPERACSSGADCQAGCVCSGGLCQNDGFSPASESCHLPPPDSYEYDDTWQSWKAYTGNPQTHSFHASTDEDWVAVYFPFAGNMRFETYNLSWGTDTKIEVYTYTNAGKGALVGSHDNIGGAWWQADAKASRVVIPVPANSAYLVRIDDKSPVSWYTDSYEYPRYSLRIMQQ